MVLIMATETTQQLGWAKEGTAGTDPINLVTSDYWDFGINTNRFDNEHPIETHQWIPEWRGDHRYPAELSLVATDARIQVSFYPVNLIPWYMVLATGATHAATAGANNVHTITPSEPGTALETYTIRSEMTGGSAEEFISMTGCKATGLNFSFNRMKFYESLSATLVFTGFETKIPTLNETHTTKVTLPTTDAAMTPATSVTSRYKWDTSALLTWDSEGDDIEYGNNLLNFNGQLINHMNIEGKENQVDIAYIDEGAYEFRFGFQLLRGSDSSIYDDFLASTDPPDEHFFFKIMAGATNYFQIEYKDVGVSQCKANKAKYQGSDKTLPVWDVMGSAENVSITGKDQLSTTAAQNKYYGEVL